MRTKAKKAITVAPGKSVTVEAAGTKLAAKSNINFELSLHTGKADADKSIWCGGFETVSPRFTAATLRNLSQSQPLIISYLRVT